MAACTSNNVELIKNVEGPKLKAALLAPSPVRDLGFTPIQRMTGGIVSDFANDVSAGPFDPHLIQASVDFGSHVVFPDGVKLMVDDKYELLELALRLRALGPPPRSDARLYPASGLHLHAD
jgi:hypothetical protein